MTPSGATNFKPHSMKHSTPAYISAALLLFTTLACGSGEKPATPEQKANLQELVGSASEHLKGSDRFAVLVNPSVPTLDTAADFYSKENGVLQYIGEKIVATVRNDTAEILFTVMDRPDSTTQVEREAVVYMTHDSGKWTGAGAFIIDQE